MHYKIKIKVQVTFKKVSVRHFRRVIFIFEMVPIKQKSNSLGIKKKDRMVAELLQWKYRQTAMEHETCGWQEAPKRGSLKAPTSEVATVSNDKLLTVHTA